MIGGIAANHLDQIPHISITVKCNILEFYRHILWSVTVSDPELLLMKPISIKTDHAAAD